MSYADDDDWDEPDDESDDGPDTATCPYCNDEIYGDTVRCPHCGNYISKEDAPPGRKPAWLVLGAIAVLAIIAMWILRGM
jgi:hypothetical protein